MLDTNDAVDAFVKNGDSGFIPYMHNGQPHDYVPDFIVRIRCDSPLHLIVETKGFDGWRGQGRRGRAMGCRGQRGRRSSARGGTPWSAKLATRRACSTRRLASAQRK